VGAADAGAGAPPAPNKFVCAVELGCAEAPNENSAGVGAAAVAGIGVAPAESLPNEKVAPDDAGTLDCVVEALVGCEEVPNEKEAGVGAAAGVAEAVAPNENEAPDDAVAATFLVFEIDDSADVTAVPNENEEGAALAVDDLAGGADVVLPPVLPKENVELFAPFVVSLLSAGAGGAAEAPNENPGADASLLSVVPAAAVAPKVNPAAPSEFFNPVPAPPPLPAAATSPPEEKGMDGFPGVAPAVLTSPFPFLDAGVALPNAPMPNLLDPGVLGGVITD